MMTDEEFLSIASPKGTMTEEEFMEAGKEPPPKALEKLEEYPSYVKYPILAARGLARAVPGSADVGSLITSTLKGVPFAEERAKQAEIERAAEKTYPVTTYGGELAGAMALPLARPAGAVARAAEPLVGGAASRALGMGTVGAGYGAASGMTSEGDIGERWQRAKEEALIGGVGGAAIPPIIDVVGKGVGKAVDVAQKVMGKSTAQETFQRALEASKGITEGRLTPAQVAEAEAAGQPVLPIDIGGAPLKREAKTALQSSMEARDILLGSLQERAKGQQGRLYDFAEKLTGKNLSDPDVIKGIKDASRAVNTPAYEAAHIEAATKDLWTPKLQDLANHPWIKDAVPKALEEVNADRIGKGLPGIKNPFTTDKAGKIVLKKGEKPTLELWDAIKKNVDGRIRAAEPTATTRGEPNVVRIGNAVTRNLTGELDTVVPKYGQARSGAARYLGEESSFRFGQKFASTTKADAINQGVKAISKFTPEELEHAQHSYMMERIQKFMAPGEQRDISKIGRGAAQKNKDIAILGKDKADKLEAFLTREELMNKSLSALGGSDTAANFIAKAKNFAEHHGGIVIGGVGGAWEGFHDAGADPVEIAKSAAKGMLAGFLAERALKIGEKSAIDLANKLVSDDPTVRDEAIKIISTNPKAMDALRRADSAMTALTVKTRELVPQKPKDEEMRTAPAYATGGRIGVTADTLMRMVERSRKKIQDGTKRILETPDEHVVHALKVANQHI
jgi:hypothetical protein